MSWAPQATTESGQWVGNGLRFATREEAEAYVAGLSSGRKTRVVGEAIDQGYTFLRLTCGCGRITDYPFTLLLQRKGVSRDSFIGNIRFRCKNCGGKEIKIGVHSQAPPLTP